MDRFSAEKVGMLYVVFSTNMGHYVVILEKWDVKIVVRFNHYYRFKSFFYHFYNVIDCTGCNLDNR